MRERATTTRARGLALGLMAGTALTTPGMAQELPTGPDVVHGSVEVATPATGRMAIRQGADAAIVNWEGFSIGAGGSVDVRQPSTSSAMLNRVTGGGASEIAGSLTANGRVFLVNPNGVVITREGSVRAGAFVASTLAMSDEVFVSGRHEFRGAGRSATVENHGAVEIGPGGYAALIGGRVENTGTISVPLGRIGLAAGEAVTLDLSGDSFLSVAVPSEGEGELIRQSGRLSADGGRVEMRAATARHAARHAINLSGVVEARTVGGRSGAVILGGGPGGTVTITGRVEATAPIAVAAPEVSPRPEARPATGGRIDVTGDRILLTGATLDASGRDGGGTVRVGGGFQGGGDLPRSSLTAVDANTRIAADALNEGDGGRAILWSDGLAAFEGAVSARGGPRGGDGGFVEVSGRARLTFAGSVDLSAPAGAPGMLLLDPYDVTIAEGPTAGGEIDDGEFEPTGEGSVLNAGDLVAALETGNVVVSTEDDGEGDDDGDITVAAPLLWFSGSALTLDADADIALGSPITAPHGGLDIDAGGTVSATAPIDVGAFVLGSGDWVQNAAGLPGGALPGFSADDFSLLGGSFLRVAGGDGSAADPYLVTDVYGLQGIGSDSPGAQASYALTNDIDASGTADWNGGAGFDPLPIAFDPEFDFDFDDVLDGQGHEISGLFIDRPTDFEVGLISDTTDAAVVQDLALSGVNVRGGARTGGLIGANGGTVSQVLVTGAIEGSDAEDDDFDFDELLVGGLAGVNDADGTILRSASDAAVTVSTAGDVQAGGLVGRNLGDLTDARAGGAVTVENGSSVDAAGLVGANGGSIMRSLSTGSVTSEDPEATLGGLVATGTVSVLDPSDDAGAATFEGTVSGSFWDIEASGVATSAGGTGLATSELQSTQGFLTQDEAQSWDFGTVWAPPEPGFDPTLYISSPVIFVDLSDATAQYGLQEETALESAAFGGPDLYVFGPDGDEVVLPPAISPGLPDGPVGAYPITVAEPTVASEGGVDYRLVTLDGTLTITEAPLVIRVPDQTKVLGAALDLGAVDFVVEGLAFDDAVTDLDLVSAGASADAPIAASPAPIQVVEVEGVGLDNYEISFDLGEVIIEPGPGDPPGPDEPGGLRELFRSAAFQTPGVLLPDPEDVIIVPGAGGGPIREAAATRTDPVTAAEETLAALEGFGAELEAALEACRRSEPTVEAYLDCLGRELDRYAAALDEIALDLPEPLRGVSAIIREASREVSIIREEAVERLAEAEDDAERERIGQDAIAQARETIRTASIEVQQAIELVFVEEPRLATLYTEQGNAIQAALDSVDTELVLVSGL